MDAPDSARAGSQSSPTDDEADDASQVGSTTQAPAATPNLGAARLFEPGSAPEMPAVQQHALDAARTKSEKAKQASPSPNVRDVDGRAFDPVLHQTNPDGSPIMNKDGTCRKYGGRAGSAAAHSARKTQVNGPAQSRLDTAGPAPPSADEQAADKIAMQVKATAQLSASLTFRIATMFGGKEFEPTAGEPEAVADSYEAVYLRHGVTDLPPIAALVAVLFVYGSKRWNAPAVIEKRKSIREWIAHKWISFWFRKKDAKTKATRDAHAVSRDDKSSTALKDMMAGPAAN